MSYASTGYLNLYPSAPPMEPPSQHQPAPITAYTYVPSYYKSDRSGYVDSVVELMATATILAKQKLGIGQAPAIQSSSSSWWQAIALRPSTYVDNSTRVNINSGNVTNTNSNNINNSTVVANKKKDKKLEEDRQKNAIVIGGIALIVGIIVGTYKYAMHQNLQDVRYDVKSIEKDIHTWGKDPHFQDLQTIQAVCQDTKELLSAQNKKSRNDLILVVSAVASSALLLGAGITEANGAITFGAVALAGTAGVAFIRAVYNWARNDYTTKTAEKMLSNCEALKQVKPNFFVIQNNQWVPAHQYY